MEWIDVNERLPEPATLEDWDNEQLYGKHSVLVIVRKNFITGNDINKIRTSIEIVQAMYVYDDKNDRYIWCGCVCGDILFWCKHPELPNVDLMTVNGTTDNMCEHSFVKYVYVPNKTWCTKCNKKFVLRKLHNGDTIYIECDDHWKPKNPYKVIEYA